jgi:hypothetical protein
MRLHPNPIIVIGMQRSGTSALSGALNRLGLFFGNGDWSYPPDPNRQHGLLEHRKATILNLRCLETFQMHSTSINEMPLNWDEHPLAESLKAELRGFLLDEFSGVGRWGINQPLTTLVLPLYRAVFDELEVSPQYVLCVRNPIEVMRTEAQLDIGQSYRLMQSPGKRAIGSWLRYNLGSFAGTVGNPLTVVVYDKLVTSPLAQLQRIVGRHPDWTPSSEAWDAATNEIRGDLRHNNESTDELNTFPSIVRRTYELAAGSYDEDPRDAALVLHWEFVKWSRLFADPQPTEGKFGVAWLHSGKPRIAEAHYTPAFAWQTARLSIDAPPNTLVSGLIYGLPCRVWIRRSVWNWKGRQTQADIRSGIGSVIGRDHGLVRLDAVFEPDQIQILTPQANSGPYELEVEFFLETSPSIASEAAARLAKSLEECVAVIETLAPKAPGSQP